MKKELIIANNLKKYRKLKKYTQDDIAEFLGITKASVSKWETGKSYPDISLLPSIANYLDIRIDELFSYEPDLSLEEIRQIYRELTHVFTVEDIDTAYAKLMSLYKKHYHCYAFVLAVALFIMNHYKIIESSQYFLVALQTAKNCCARVQTESNSALLILQAKTIEALCSLIEQKPNEVITLLEDNFFETYPMNNEVLLANAYTMLGKSEKANGVYKIGIFKNLQLLLNISLQYLQTNIKNREIFLLLKKQIDLLFTMHDFEMMSPIVVIQYQFLLAHGYMYQDNESDALKMLEEILALPKDAFHDFTLRLHPFFDEISEWIENSLLGTQAPRDIDVIQAELLSLVAVDSELSIYFSENQRYLNFRNKYSALIEK